VELIAQLSTHLINEWLVVWYIQIVSEMLVTWGVEYNKLYSSLYGSLLLEMILLLDTSFCENVI